MILDQVIAAWLDEKRIDDEYTAEAYEKTLTNFRETHWGAGLDLERDPALVAPLAQGVG